jgi:predicted ATPase
LEYEVTRQTAARFVVRGNAQGVEFPSVELPDRNGTWILSRPALSPADLSLLSRLKQLGKDGTVIELLRQLDEQITGIELLAPTGRQAMVFIRVAPQGLLPLQMMGEGVQRCFELAVVLAANDVPVFFSDEIENGLHYSVLEPLWDWIAKTSALRSTQLFATTHSEECVQAACRAFSARSDDGLRVIRLDRQEHETKAVVYDRNLIEAAERMGVEIRG